MNYPILSFLMNVRVRTDLDNPKVRDIVKFFRDMTTRITTTDYEKVEFIIKFDSDDTYANKAWNQIIELPLRLKKYTYSRWEGMYSSHHFYTHSFCRISPYSKFIGFAGDDAVAQHISQDNIACLERHINYDYIFFTNKIEMTRPDRLNKVNRWDKTKFFDVMTPLGLIEPYPILSRKLVEICGMGFHQNIDTWFSLIACIIFNKYSLLICRNIPRQTFMRDNTQSQDIIRDDFHIYKENKVYNGYKTNWNQDMENLPTYIKLAEQAADNIALNIKEDGLWDKYWYDPNK
ncbi:hypothetical protein LCGC14_1767810 [marine sediment metagenome]|uniref:Glycosyltransferase 2-like domain-containing protein n=1 Tax=marine sediment metagenome TaxID=412755 RepID=A0A0F9JYV5_9ZZZZ